MYNINMDLMMILMVVVILVVCLTVHEIAHGLVAYWLGDDTAKVAGRLTLNPFAHLEPFMSFMLPMMCVMFGTPVIGGARPVPVNSRKLKWGEWGVALVALAGPLSNFLMAFVAFGIFSIFNINQGLPAYILAYFVRINLGLMLFNLLPIPPLDGSKIIYPLAPEFVQNFFKNSEKNLLLIFMLILIFSTQISALVGLGETQILAFFYSIF